MTWGDVPRRRRIPGGNPPMRPDQAAAQPRTRAGSGPAPSSSVVVARLVIIVGATGALFVYSPAAGAGNLLASLAASAGVDSFGNPFDAGLTVGPHAGAHIGLGLTGDLFVHNAATKIVDQIHSADGSIRIYNSAGAGAGNLIVSISPIAGTDAFGNTYPEGLQVTQGTISGTAITAGTISGTTISASTISGSAFDGTDFILNAAGAFFYNGTPALGNLIAAIAAVAGTDGFGNTFLAGITQINAAQTLAVQIFNGLVEFINLASQPAVIPNVQAAGSAAGSGLQLTSGAATGALAAILTLQDSLLSTLGLFPVMQFNGGMSLTALLSSGAGAAFQGGVAAASAVLTQAAAGSEALGVLVTGDSNRRLSVHAAGSLNWGSGGGAADVSLSRQSAGVLAIAGALAAATAAAAGGILTVTNTTVTPTAPTVQLVAAAAADRVLGIEVAADANFRWRIDSNGAMVWGPGTAVTDCTLSRQAAGIMQLLACDLDIATIGNGLRIKEGTNARMGTAVLVAGTVTVANTSITAATRIFLTCQVLGGTQGILRVAARTAGTQFIITSSNAADTSTVAWLLVEPG